MGSRRERSTRRPGSRPGRSRTWGLALLLVVVVATPVLASSSGDLFSWWRRQLLPLSFPEGGWVTVAREEVAEGQVLSDTLTCRVLTITDPGARWILVESAGETDRWILEVEVERLGPDHAPLDAVRSLHRWPRGGKAQPEDLVELRENSFARRSLEDMFQSPEVTRTDRPDSLIAGVPVRRQTVELVEVQETRLPMGDRAMVHTTDLRSRATLSPDVPILGVLASFTRTVSSTRWEGNVRGQRSAQPPLVSETRTRCLDFGIAVPEPLPEGIRP